MRLEEIDINKIVSEIDTKGNSILGELENVLKIEFKNDVIQECSLKMDLDFPFDFERTFDVSPQVSLPILDRITAIRYMIININEALASAVEDLECCESGRLYNQTVVPIFKWIAEDENGFCGTLMTLLETLSSIHLTLKNIFCLVKPVPGNPTLDLGGIDPFKYINGPLMGAEKVLNLMMSGQILDIPIKYLKEIHDSILSCLGTKYQHKSIPKIETVDNKFRNLEQNTLDTLEKFNSGDIKIKKPVEPELEVLSLQTFSENNPMPQKNFNENDPLFYKKVEVYNKEMDEWYNEYNKSLNDITYRNDIKIQTYKKELTEYNKQMKKLNLNPIGAYNARAVIDQTDIKFRKRYSGICSCIGGLLGHKGIYGKRNYIIRDNTDLKNIRGQVLFLGYTEDHGYTDDSVIPIIENPKELLQNEVKRDNAIMLEYYGVKKEFQEPIKATNTIYEVIALNDLYNKEINLLNQQINVIEHKKERVLEDLKRRRKVEEVNLINKRNLLLQTPSKREELKEINNKLEKFYNTLSENDTNVVELDTQISKLKIEIDEYNEAKLFNHAVVEVVDDSLFECNCNLICMLVQYVLKYLQNLINAFIAFLAKYILKMLVDSDTAWLIKYIEHKLQCIINIVNLPKQLSTLREKFDNELNSYKNSIREARELVCIDESEDNHFSSTEIINDGENTSKPIVYPLPDDKNITDDLSDLSSEGNTYTVYTKDVTFDEQKTKNPLLPPAILNCEFDHLFKLSWEPTSDRWSIHVDFSITNLEQRNTTVELPTIEDNSTDVNLLQMSYLEKLILLAYENEIDIKVTTTESYILENFSYINKTIFGETEIKLDDINKLEFMNPQFNIWSVVWFKNESQPEKVIEDFKQKLQEQKELSEIEPNLPPISINSKACSLDNLQINDIKFIYSDPDHSLYSGELTKGNSFVNEDGDTDWYYFVEPHIVNENGIEQRIVRPNVPILIELSNSGGNLFHFVLLLDFCNPNELQTTQYSKETDGLILNDKYPILDYVAIPNNATYTMTKSQIIGFAQEMLDNEGFINIKSGLGSSAPVNEGVTNDEYKKSLGNKSYLGELNKIDTLIDSINDIISIELVVPEMDINLTLPVEESKEILDNKKDSFSLPLIVLNEDKNIILTIRENKLVVTNLNNSITGLNFELDIEPSSDFGVGFINNGVNYEIYYHDYINKSVKSLKTMSLTNIELKPTNIGSFYKFGSHKICGRINAINVFNGSVDVTPEDIFVHDHEYRPLGYIGYYDFSVFDGQRVYSIPEKLQVVDFVDSQNVIGIKVGDGDNKVKIIGNKPITCYGNYQWEENNYYKSVSYACLENFFCRDNLLGKPFTLNFWLRKLPEDKFHVESDNQYILSDTNNGNFIWWNKQEKTINIKLQGHDVTSRKFDFTHYTNLNLDKPDLNYWFFNTVQYDVINSKFIYSVKFITDDVSELDPNYNLVSMPELNFEINLKYRDGFGKSINFSLVTMLARFAREDYHTDFFFSEVFAICILNKVQSDEERLEMFNYQKEIIEGLK